ncbi:MAG: CoB--CoM heterodisulfide reductase iron-sulfur subunit A family protein [Candidatus Aminicenantes bacterium]|nr:CoB--CoM heterodisulfide reductase iron-sulfur subunit A family protein [Candidatus Aminicenantes bacterium]
MNEQSGLPKVGVFVCRCGVNIGGFLDTAALVEYAKTLPGVVFAKANLYSCSESGTAEIKKAIQENKLQRVVVAACTPLTHEPLFRAICQEAGVNPYLFEFVNIREHCSWAHMKEGEEATNKAKDLIRMGVARAIKLEPLEPIEAGVEPSALVIGGGISGLVASASLAERGFRVALVERETELGGILRHLYKLYPSDVMAEEVLKPWRDKVIDNPLIDLYLESEVISVKGYIGNYNVVIKSPEKEIPLKTGVIILAAGARLWEPPEGLYGYNKKNVITQLELENLLMKGKLKGDKVVMIQCVGAMSPERSYCSRICCVTAIKNAILIKELNPAASVHILYRQMQAYGDEYESYLRRAKELGVRLVNFSPEQPPVVEDQQIKVYHQLLGRELTLPFDLLVLSTPLVSQQGSEALGTLLKVPIDQDGFFLEAHIKLRPLDFSTDGIYLCGCAHYPADVGEAVSQALGAASRASIHLTRGYIKVEPIVSSLIDEGLCQGCGLCAGLCPYGAIEMVDTPQGKKAKVISVACKGCGICAASCYCQAIKLSHYTREQLEAQIRALLSA